MLVDKISARRDDTYEQKIEWLDAGTAGFACSSDHRVDILLFRESDEDSIYVEIPQDTALEPETKDWADQNPEKACQLPRT